MNFISETARVRHVVSGVSVSQKRMNKLTALHNSWPPLLPQSSSPFRHITFSWSFYIAFQFFRPPHCALGSCGCIDWFTCFLTTHFFLTCSDRFSTPSLPIATVAFLTVCSVLSIYQYCFYHFSRCKFDSISCKIFSLHTHSFVWLPFLLLGHFDLLTRFL